MPVQLGGLGSNVVFIDGENTFRLYNIARLAQVHQLNPTKTLEHVFISRAFTVYQLTSLIMENLEETLKTYNAKLAIIFDIAGFFLDNDVPQEEAQRIYSQIVSYLSNFARKHQIIVITTFLPYESSKRNRLLREMTFARASTVLSFIKTKYMREVSIEKHPSFVTGTAELPSENLTLTDFIGAEGSQKGLILLHSC